MASFISSYLPFGKSKDENMPAPEKNRQWTTGQDGLDKLAFGEGEVPKPKEGEVLVKVLAVGLNYRDTEGMLFYDMEKGGDTDCWKLSTVITTTMPLFKTQTLSCLAPICAAPSSRARRQNSKSALASCPSLTRPISQAKSPRKTWPPVLVSLFQAY